MNDQGRKGSFSAKAFEAWVPDIYMPRLQLFIRMLLGTLSALYFNYISVPVLILSVTQINLLIVCYVASHVFLWLYQKRKSTKNIMLHLGAWMDIMGAFITTLCDPVTIPPMTLLFLIAVVGNGIQQGLHIAIESMIGSLLLGLAVLFIHYSLLGHVPSFSLYFYLLLISISAIYAYVLVQRIELMKTAAIRISEHDSLTGLMNRRAFLRTAEYLLVLNERKRIPLVLIFADLDNFKTVNDEFGHEMGDKVLRQFSDMAKANFRQSDIIARYGGDEFVIILTNTSPEDAESAVKKFQNDFRDWARNNGLQVGSSFGLGMVPEGKNNLSDILRQVDAALYEAKLKKNHIHKAILVKTKDGNI